MATNQLRPEDQLRVAYEAAQKRPEKDQAMIAKQILDAIADQEWDELLSKPEAQKVLRKLADEAWEEDSRGETEEGGFDICTDLNS
jgi:hypothetical protein